MAVKSEEQLKVMQGASENGNSLHLVPFDYYTQAGIKRVNLFTEPALRDVIEHSGLTVNKLEWNKFPEGKNNQQGENFRESIKVIAQKP